MEYARSSRLQSLLDGVWEQVCLLCCPLLFIRHGIIRGAPSLGLQSLSQRRSLVWNGRGQSTAGEIRGFVALVVFVVVAYAEGGADGCNLEEAGGTLP